MTTKSEWEVFSKVFGGKYFFRVGRIKNINEPLEGIEYYQDENTKNGWTENFTEAEDLAIKLNGAVRGEEE